MKRDRWAQSSRVWAPLVLGIAVLTAYSNSFRSGLVFDNAVLISQDPRVHAWTPHNLSLILSEGYWRHRADAGLYRPLTTLSFLANYVAFANGPQPASYHWVNLALHEINVMLVYALGLLLFGRRWPAFALAGLWGLHPLHTEVVTNIVGRADLLAAFGVLAGVLCYARSAGAEGRRRLGWVAGLAAAQAIGIFSKESAAALPGILLVYDWMTAQAGTWRRRFLPYAAVAIPLAAYLSLRIALGIHLRPTDSDNPIVGAGFLAGRMTAFEVLGRLAWLFVWPAGLSADYSYRAIPVLAWQTLDWESIAALVTAAALLAGTWFAVSRMRNAAAFCFFPLFFWIAYLPASNLPIAIGSIMAERFLYLPSVGLTGWAVAAALSWKRAWWGVPAVVCFAFGARTFVRNRDWRDERSLWASAVTVTPGSARAHNNLGTALPVGPAELPEAIAEFETAVQIRPDFAEAHNNLGSALLHMPGRLADAIAEFRAALRIRPEYAEAHYNLGSALLEAPDRLAGAIGELQTALRLRPDFAEAHYNLGLALLRAPGRFPDAIGEFQAALDIRPDYAEVHNDLGRAYLQAPGRLPDAVAQFEAALRARPDFADAHYNLGNALLQMPGRLDDAVSQYEAALRLGRDLAEGHYNLARALLLMPGRTPDAIHELETAVRLKPDFAEGHYNLAIVLRQVPGREVEAAREMATALEIMPALGQPRK